MKKPYGNSSNSSIISILFLLCIAYIPLLPRIRRPKTYFLVYRWFTLSTFQENSYFHRARWKDLDNHFTGISLIYFSNIGLSINECNLLSQVGSIQEIQSIVYRVIRPEFLREQHFGHKFHFFFQYCARHVGWLVVAVDDSLSFACIIYLFIYLFIQ